MPIVGNGMITLGMSNSRAHINQYYKEYLQTQSRQDQVKHRSCLLLSFCTNPETITVG